MFKENTLEGKVIAITGGGSGLGLAMAKGFAACGAEIAICGRTEEKLIHAANEIKEVSTENTVKYYVCDVREYDKVEGFRNAVVNDFGRIDGLVNNAAGNFLAASEDLTPGGFKAVTDIVLNGTFNCTHSFGNYFIDQKVEGTILNIVTTYAENTGSAFVLPSACSKAGVLALTKSLAYEWGTYGIRLNAIAPGPFPTEGAWTRLMPDERFEKMYLSKIPAQRYGKKNELANLAVFLMSDMATYITGECVVIDGGERLQAGQFNILNEVMPREQLKQIFRSMKP
jgi:NAD(P)-dependent dehydrogenase (short-subunit alcohol dehydrogenase family)